MSSPVAPIRFPVPPEGIPPGGRAASGNVFGEVLRQAVESTERMGGGAAARIERFLAGEGEELHDVVMEAQKAQLALELFTQVRNKVVEAYQEVMRTQI
jgi:flagellar hook-basal body complex protein FliE